MMVTVFKNLVAKCTPQLTRARISTYVDVTTASGTKSIVLSNPKRRNPLSLEVIQTLKQEILEDTDPELRCIVLSAVGKVFSSGHNLTEMTKEVGREKHEQIFQECSELMLGIRKAPIPVIAKVDGIAAAAGCQLVASCDIVIATRNSSFITPGASVGIFCSTPGIPLVRSLPEKVAADMLLTGLPITAQRAEEVGLVSAVVSELHLDEEVDKRVKAIQQKSRSVISLGKKFMYEQMEMSISEAYRCGGRVMVDNINMKDGQEGIESFHQKRKPNWTHQDD